MGISIGKTEREMFVTISGADLKNGGNLSVKHPPYVGLIRP